jgi:hypothetical protein
VLTGLVKQIDKSVEAVALDDAGELEKVLGGAGNRG